MYNVHQNSHESFLFIRDNDCGQEQKKKKCNDITKARARARARFSRTEMRRQL